MNPMIPDRNAFQLSPGKLSATGVPDQARPAARHLQGMVPRRMLQDEERSDLEITGVVTA